MRGGTAFTAFKRKTGHWNSFQTGKGSLETGPGDEPISKWKEPVPHIRLSDIGWGGQQPQLRRSKYLPRRASVTVGELRGDLARKNGMCWQQSLEEIGEHMPNFWHVYVNFDIKCWQRVARFMSKLQRSIDNKSSQHRPNLVQKTNKLGEHIVLGWFGRQRHLPGSSWTLLERLLGGVWGLVGRPWVEKAPTWPELRT